jgi:hypothetical protein
MKLTLITISPKQHLNYLKQPNKAKHSTPFLNLTQRTQAIAERNLGSIGGFLLEHL